jgi:hypothetical protein
MPPVKKTAFAIDSAAPVWHLQVVATGLIALWPNTVTGISDLAQRRFESWEKSLAK